MNAGNTIPQAVVEKGTGARSQTTGVAAGEAAFSAHEDGVIALAAGALRGPDVRTAKVEALQALIEGGKYQVSSSKVAGSIIDQLRTIPAHRS